MVCGFSMGALQSYQWASLYPDMVDSIVPWCGAAKCSTHNYIFLEGTLHSRKTRIECLIGVKAALQADSVFNNGNYHPNVPAEGLKAFGRVYCGWCYSQDWFREAYELPC